MLTPHCPTRHEGTQVKLLLLHNKENSTCHGQMAGSHDVSWLFSKYLVGVFVHALISTMWQ